jgi:hypothetical protein
MKYRWPHEWLMVKWLVMLNCLPAGRSSRTMGQRRRGGDRGNHRSESRAATIEVRPPPGSGVDHHGRPYSGPISVGERDGRAGTGRVSQAVGRTRGIIGSPRTGR